MRYPTKQPHARARSWLLASSLGLAAVLSGCASGPGANPRDPLEPYNRAMFSFNDAVDSAVLEPVATGYRDVTPTVVRTAVTNFFANLGDLWSAVNNALQLKGEGTYNSVVRFTTNTVFGLGGLIDIASEMDIERHKQDFGLTMARYGMPAGAYIVWPLLGPSTIRDSAGMVVDWQGNVVSSINDVPVRNSLTGLRIVNTRANLLGTTSLVQSAALDKYSFTRDAYLQLRENATRSGDEEDETQWMNESAAEPAAQGNGK
ncbi:MULTISPECIES: VacJ family lipoprotein [unclassified Comamonas]|nr:MULTISPECIES: VacJ family lipoprotein [unclassified Comamonas]ULR91475.1 VacJ family lipoprotein [Comamonas sp. B21-038]